MNPDLYPFFDLKTGRPNIWHSPGENGELEFFSGSEFHPKTGKALTEITQDFAPTSDHLRFQKRREEEVLAQQKLPRKKRSHDKTGRGRSATTTGTAAAAICPHVRRARGEPPMTETGGVLAVGSLTTS